MHAEKLAEPEALSLKNWDEDFAEDFPREVGAWVAKSWLLAHGVVNWAKDFVLIR